MVYIEENGDVYPCCHKQNSAIGNIYKENLRQIYGNELAQGLRRQSLSGRLKCFHGCIMLQKPDRRLRDSYRPDAGYNQLKTLHITFGQACNIKCIMCRQDAQCTGYLDDKVLIRNIDISTLDIIILQGGEPLFINSARSFFDYAVSCGKKPSLLTNGLLINDAWAEKIARNSKAVCFSINAATKATHEFVNRGSSWDAVINNIRRVREAKKRFGSKVKILGHMTIVLFNLDEIPLFMEKFRELGFDGVDFGYDIKSVPLYLQDHPAHKKSLRTRIKNAIAKLRDSSSINTFRLELLGLI